MVKKHEQATIDALKYVDIISLKLFLHLVQLVLELRHGLLSLRTRGSDLLGIWDNSRLLLGVLGLLLSRTLLQLLLSLCVVKLVDELLVVLGLDMQLCQVLEID